MCSREPLTVAGGVHGAGLVSIPRQPLGPWCWPPRRLTGQASAASAVLMALEVSHADL